MERWYASVMLNRLMFIYFIQKKNFLDNDPNYLRNRLSKSKSRGKDKYYTEFLCPLFFEGFAKKKDERSASVNELLGEIPYLNGGIFQRHQIEELHRKTIKIADYAFEKLFSFFEQYHWHLDERPLRADNEINPDVLGYIFEKYINQKQMGAYYTKEDITEYIGKNTIVPYLFDAAEKKCKIAFEGENSFWRLLQEDPDRYIYDAVRRGVIDEKGEIIPETSLPEFVQTGMHDPKARMFDKRYNLTEVFLPDESGINLTLPTETWREYIERRKRCLELREKLARGEIRNINDLITYNLNIRQFAQDVIENCEGPELLRAFWHAINGRIPEKSNENFEYGVTILDPACGSGAFLFAALNILEPLYEACLQRMETFLGELEQAEEPHRPEKYSDFRRILEKVEEHPNRRYFILKSIIVNNLFGVDIMEEAVEICKLRMFLKLVAQIDDVNRIEPLPDIDFNIRAGNSLVGFTSLQDVERAIKGDLVKELALPGIIEKAELADSAFRIFRQQQTALGGDVSAEDKNALQGRLKELEDELNKYLAGEYGIEWSKNHRYEGWLKSHKPFHWFIEFYGIMRKGGFDVIIGNPPYVEYSKVRGEYELLNFKTLSCGNLYAQFIEKSQEIKGIFGKFGMIVQNSVVSTDRMLPAINLLCNNNTTYISNFDDRPAKLFTGLNHMKGSIILAFGNIATEKFSMKFLRWYDIHRPYVFDSLKYEKLSNEKCEFNHIPKMSYKIELDILRKIYSHETLEKNLHGDYLVFCHRIASYFIKAIDFIPFFWNETDEQKRSDDYKVFNSKTQKTQRIILCLLNSSTFYYSWHVFEDGYHCGRAYIEKFPCSLNMTENILKKLFDLGELIARDYKNNSGRRETYYKKTGKVVYDEFFPKKSKQIIDKIDCLLAQHYGFTDEELDFIINYDIKYRMGLHSGEIEED